MPLRQQGSLWYYEDVRKSPLWLHRVNLRKTPSYCVTLLHAEVYRGVKEGDRRKERGGRGQKERRKEEKRKPSLLSDQRRASR